MDRDPRSRRSLWLAAALLCAAAGLGGCLSQSRNAAHLEPVAATPLPGDGSRLRPSETPEPVASFGLLSEPAWGAEPPDRP